MHRWQTFDSRSVVRPMFRTARLCSIFLIVTIRAMAQELSPATTWLQALGPVPALEIPASPEAWASKRSTIRSTLTRLLGDLPARPTVPQVKVLSKEDHGDYSLEKFEFDNGAGEQVRGYCFLPAKATNCPAILYCHWHGGQYDIGKEELLQTNAVPVPPGPALAKAGYVVLGIDACGFGERNGAIGDKGSAGELSASKFNLWAGRTLWGMIVRDDLMALDYLCSRPEVDATRIGVTGISMGSTRAWWVMALDDRPRAGVCIACMTRYQDLIAAGMLKAHGIYYYVPGMLKHFDTEAVIACAAPRPMLFQTGDQDGGSPIEGVRKLGDIVGQVYAVHGKADHFENTIYPGVAHVYLPEMWTKTVAWMDRWVKAAR